MLLICLMTNAKTNLYRNPIGNIIAIMCLVLIMTGCGRDGLTDSILAVTLSYSSEMENEVQGIDSAESNISTVDLSNTSEMDTGAQDFVVADSTITVYFSNELGRVNKFITGSALEGWNHALMGIKNAYPNAALSNYGEGVWNPDTKKTVKEVIDLAKNAGLSSMRFTTTNFYKWKRAIGKERTEFLFGIDEFMKATGEIGAEPVFTIGYKLEDPQDAADLVEYLNSPDNGNHPWAAKRAENGHPVPYNVKYFEIGNEVFNNTLNVSADEYAIKYLQYYEAMKSVDPSVQIGVVLEYEPWYLNVLEIIKERVDFGIVHFYPQPPGIGATDERLKTMTPTDIFSASLAIPVLSQEMQIQQMLRHLKQFSGRDIPLTVTEHNGGFAQEYPVPYRHTLGTALLNAEMLRIFMKPENNILMANYHHFIDGYWGMIKAESNFMTHDYRTPINYRKRPNYYVYELYNNYFGQILINAEVESDAYYIVQYHIPVQYLSVNASKSEDGKKVYLMVINKSMDKYASTLIDLKGLPAEWDSGGIGSTAIQVDTWILNGPEVSATNEDDPDNVKIVYKGFSSYQQFFQLQFEPHSVTAIEISSPTLH